ncbi:MAG: polyprenyl synthetase family protein [Candidatus Aminicenantes bacterium]|nr:polyprenyl synthetase family protein [Candidatus Aminicenantes bacterium]
MEFFKDQREKIIAFLDSYLEEKGQEFSRVNSWGRDAVNRLGPFIKSGKMLRGGLVCLGYMMSSGKMESVVIPAAGAVEFLQTALLIHDDIIDRDTYRRGHPSLFYQYTQRGKKEGISDPTHFGECMALCLGDIGFFLAFEIFSKLEDDKAAKERVVCLWSKELCFVGLAQMQDLYFGETEKNIAAEDIVQLYHYKTARYSFSLPLKTGAILGGGKPGLLAGLESCGHDFGLLFQLKDDELGLYGSEEELGKPVGSDLREHKKTLHYHYLFQKAVAQDRQKFEEICGSSELSLEMVKEVRGMMAKYGIDEIIHDRMRGLEAKILKEIDALEIDQKSRLILCDLLEYSQNRIK